MDVAAAVVILVSLLFLYGLAANALRDETGRAHKTTIGRDAGREKRIARIHHEQTTRALQRELHRLDRELHDLTGDPRYNDW